MIPTNSHPKPKVTFWGAAQTVTGSMHLVDLGERSLLLDCGQYRGANPEHNRRNRELPMAVDVLDAVILSHAHTDHCGNLPALVARGYSGPIYCTPPTRDLVEIMLLDSARIHDEDSRQLRIALGDRGESEIGFSRPLVSRTLERVKVVPYDTWREISSRVRFRLLDAGHILGSAMTQLIITGSSGEHSLTFTGDLGRRGLPFVAEPTVPPASDLLICESTYGGSRHKSLPFMAQVMAEVVRETAARGGKVLIPAFSLGRTQVVAHYLQKWMSEGLVPSLPLYIDSPLAKQIAAVHRRHFDYLKPLVEPDGLNGKEPFSTPAYLDRPDDSEEASRLREPAIIVASGGMCESGRILRHLRLHIDDPRSTLVLVSYQSPASLGRKLLERRPTVRFHGRKWNKWIDVVELNGFSGHADHDDFVNLLGPLAGQVKKTCLVHGEKEQSEALARSLRDLHFQNVHIPRLGESVEFP